MSFKYHYHLLFTITQYHSHLLLTTAKYHSQLLLNTAKYYSLCYLPLQSTRYLVSFVKFSKSINPTCYLRQQSTNVIWYLQRYHFLSTAAKYHYHLLLTQAKYHSHLSLTTAKYHYHLLLQQILPPLVTYNNRVPLHLLLITANYHSHFLPTTANYHFNLLLKQQSTTTTYLRHQSTNPTCYLPQQSTTPTCYWRVPWTASHFLWRSIRYNQYHEPFSAKIFKYIHFTYKFNTVFAQYKTYYKNKMECVRF